ncbi:MAG: hypothetical protein ACYTF1_13185 [Planctomycetota bacterium]
MDWVQPVYHSKHKQNHQLIALLKKVINRPTEGADVQNQWQEIQIHLQAPESGPQTHNPHFLIDHKGNMSATENWRIQKQSPTPGVIRIGILCPSNVNYMTRPQAHTAQKLVIGLQQLCKIPSSGIIWSKNLDLSTRGPMSHTVRPISTSVP